MTNRLIKWATDANYPAGDEAWSATPVRKEPTMGQIAAGFVPGAKIPAEFVNWVLGIFSDMIARAYLIWAMNWTIQTPAASPPSVFFGIVYGPADDLWVAVGQNGKIQTSPDGVVWTARTAAGGYASTFYGVAYAGGYFAAAGGGGSNQLQTSPDGTTWTARSAGSNAFYEIVGTDDTSTPSFVAVGNAAEIRTCSTSDITTWTHRAAGSSFSGWFDGVAWSPDWDGGTWWICGENCELQRCGANADVSTWTRVAHGFTGGDFDYCSYGNGTLVIFRSGGRGVLISTDGETFESITWAGQSGDLWGRGFCDGVFFTQDDAGTWASVDGREWILIPSLPVATYYMTAFAAGQNRAVAVGTTGSGTIATSYAHG